MISQILESKINSIPFLSNLEAKIINSGWVGRNYHIATDISPILNNAGEMLLIPIINSFLSNMPQDTLPAIAHSIVDNGISNGSLAILDDMITIEADDLQELKHLLNRNLPLECNYYQVVE